jgi:hypothetical protein
VAESLAERDRPDSRSYWLFIAARASTRQIRSALNREGSTAWSAPRDLRAGDLALLCNLDGQEEARELPGRMQIEWLLRALSDAIPDSQRKWSATFEGVPLPRPVALADAVEGHRFADDPGEALEGQHRWLERDTWRELTERIDERNVGFAARVEDRAALEELFAGDLPDSPTQGSTGRASRANRRTWRTQLFLQSEVADLIEAEGWAERFDPLLLGLTPPRLGDYRIPGVGWYADDLFKLGDRQLVVVEYELRDHGGRDHGVPQAHNYRREIENLLQDLLSFIGHLHLGCDYRREREKLLRGWAVDAAVIAEDFEGDELEMAAELEVECLRAKLDENDSLRLAHIGVVQGPIWRSRKMSLRS